MADPPRTTARGAGTRTRAARGLPRPPPELRAPFCHGLSPLPCPRSANPVPQTARLKRPGIKAAAWVRKLEERLLPPALGAPNTPDPCGGGLREALGDRRRAPTRVESQTALCLGPGFPTGRRSRVTACPSPPSKQAASPGRERAGPRGRELGARAEPPPAPRATPRGGGGYPNPKPNAPRQEINSFPEDRSGARRIRRSLGEPVAAGWVTAGALRLLP